MPRDDRDYFSSQYLLSSILIGTAVFLLGRAFIRLEHAVVGPPSNFGYVPDPVGTKKFLAELGDAKFFSQAAPEAMEKVQEVDTFLWRAMDKASRARYGKPFVVGKQGIGDCVSWGAMHAVFCSESIDWDLGRLPDPPLMPSSEAIYGGSRVEARGKPGDGSSPVGGWSDGSFGGAAAKWLRDWGAVYRQPYPELGIDLTTYSPERARQWGAYGCGGQGDNGRLDAVAKRHPCKHVVAVRAWDELAAAITAGFPVTIASSQGFTTTALASPAGVCEASGTWMHQMCIIGIRFAKNSPHDPSAIDAALILNSWGPSYITYHGKFPADQPEGSFWARRSVVEKILAQGDSWAVGSVDGWKWRELNHHDWLAPAPPEKVSAYPRKPHTAKLVAGVFNLGL
jgi:hypothetical protein